MVEVSMIDFCAQRRGDSIIPVSTPDRNEMVRIPERRVFTVHVELQAPPKVQRWYRAGVDLLVEATGRWPNREIAHREIMIQSGYFESFVISTGGDVRFNPVSTQGWGYIEWREFLDRALPVMLGFAGETQARFRDRVDRFFGIRLKEAWEG